MSHEHEDEIGEIATDVDDLKLRVEEIEDNPPRGAAHDTVDALKHALEDASDAADDLENESGTKE